MDKWQRAYSGKVSFVCVSCAGPGLAVEMSKEMRLKDCVNGFIRKREEMPKWGQLGCNGFIVFDKTMRIVCRQSKAFMEVRQGAFRQVENILDQLLKTTEEDGAEDSRERKKQRRPSASAAQTKLRVHRVGDVGFSTMDKQHRRCEAVLRRLVACVGGDGTIEETEWRKVLGEVRVAFSTHFQEEEDTVLAKWKQQHDDDDGSKTEFASSANMFESHANDHKRLLKMVADAESAGDVSALSKKVKELKAIVRDAGRSTKGCVTKEDLLERARDAARVIAARDILQGWEDHERYDRAYAEEKKAEEEKDCGRRCVKSS